MVREIMKRSQVYMKRFHITETDNGWDIYDEPVNLPREIKVPPVASGFPSPVEAKSYVVKTDPAAEFTFYAKTRKGELAVRAIADTLGTVPDKRNGGNRKPKIRWR